MSFLGDDCLFPRSSFEPEDVLLKKILLTHDPDGRDLDSEELLRCVEDIICHATTSESSVSDVARGITCEIESLGSAEPLGHTLYKISHEIMCNSSGKHDQHEKMIPLFDLLGKYAWDAKLVLVLAAFAMSYGKLWLIMQLDPHNILAVSVALLKKLPIDASTVRPEFNALILLVRAMIDLTRCVVSFEGLPLQHIELDDEVMVRIKSQIYKTSYWVIRTTLTCSAKISHLIAINHEQVNSTATAIAVWELSSLVSKLNSICSHLRVEVNLCHQQIESKIHQKLLQLFKESRTDQEALSILFPSKDKFPLKDCSLQSKHSISQLKNEVVILLISKLDILPAEALFLLVQQQYEHPRTKNLDGSYVIVWFPIQSSSIWTKSEKRSFIFFSNTLPFYAIRQPWLLSPIIVNYIKHTWKFEEEPIMVVLDSQGLVTKLNALDMVLIWGSRAYPFSTSREKGIWEEQKWTLQFLIDGVDELLTAWVEQGENVCIYGGCNVEWIKELIAKVEEINNSDVRVKMVYAGTGRKTSENVKIISAVSYYLPSTKIQFLWLRLESMRRSRLRLGHVNGSDQILDELEILLDTNMEQDSWAIIGNTTDMMKFEGREVLQCLDLFHVWGNNVANLGFMGALRASSDRTPDHTGSCGHITVIPYAEGPLEKTIICDKCKQKMQKLIIYQ